MVLKAENKQRKRNEIKILFANVSKKNHRYNIKPKL